MGCRDLAAPPRAAQGRDCPAPFEDYAAAEFGPVITNNIDLTGYTKPTPVQKYAVPIVRNKRDLMACAQTGSGKTAAFLIPVIDALLTKGPVAPPSGRFNSRRKQFPPALIISPTRELTVQVCLPASTRVVLSSYKN